MLVVDDYPSVLRWVCRLFEKSGWHVDTALSADEAVIAWGAAEKQGRHLDLLVTDLIMPEMDGRSLAHLLRERLPLLPVIAITGSDDELSRWVHEPLRNAELLMKPVLSDTLLAVADRLTRPAPATS